MDFAIASFEWWNIWSRAVEITATRSGGPQAVAAAAARRTKAIVEFAARHSPFYAAYWPRLPKDGWNLQTLPVVTRQQLMARFDDWVTDPRITRRTVERHLQDRERIGQPIDGKYLVWKSSGTTGEPGAYLHDTSAVAVYQALLALELQSPRVAGHYASGMIAQSGRAALVAATEDHFASVAAWRRACGSAPWQQARSFSVARPLKDLVADLNSFQPAFLASYPSTLLMLADERCAGRLHARPSCIWSGGEYLSGANHAAIESAFETLVINEYGASECLSIARSCELGTLHVNADWVVLEPVDRHYRPTPPGKPSHTVLVTNLANRVQPLIRYDLGDSVTMLPACACGSCLPAIEAHGRSDDVLRLPATDGTVVPISPLAITTAAEEAIAGRRFQIVQIGPAALEVHLGAREDSERIAEWRVLHEALVRFLASQSVGKVDLHLSRDAPRPDPRSGKLREVVVSRPHPRRGTFSGSLPASWPKADI